jgi:hypothetical protein
MAEKKQSNNFLFYFASALLVISVCVFVFNIYRFAVFTGYATVGWINISIGSYASINFTADIINFSSGVVDGGKSDASLNTSVGTVINGNWTPVATGLVLQNIGNVNISVDMTSAAGNATNFIGGSSAIPPLYMINISNNGSSSKGACALAGNGVTLGTFIHMNASRRICDQMLFYTTNNTIRIDVFLRIPQDSYRGKLNDSLSVTATAV